MSTELETRFCVKPLDDKSLRVAEKELNEDPKRRRQDIELLRAWLKQQPHIKSIDTDEFLLRFLRAAKFSVYKAQERLENFWTHRSELPQWFRNVDITDPLMQEINDLCYSIPLPETTDDNCRVLLVRTGSWSTTKYDLNDIMKYAYLVSDMLNKDPRVQVNGWIGLIDFENITVGHAQQMTHSFVKNAVRCWQETYPGRIRNLHFLNYPKIFDVAMSVIKMCLKDKIKQRIIFHGNDVNSLHKYIPKRILPKQYGGTAGDLFELNGYYHYYYYCFKMLFFFTTIVVVVELWREELLKNDQYFHELESCGVNLNMLKQTKRQLNSTSETKNIECTGVYRKLNND